MDIPLTMLWRLSGQSTFANQEQAGEIECKDTPSVRLFQNVDVPL